MPARLLSRKKLVSCSDTANHSRHLLLGGVTLGIVITGKDMASTRTGRAKEKGREKGVEGSQLIVNPITVAEERGRNAVL